MPEAPGSTIPGRHETGGPCCASGDLRAPGHACSQVRQPQTHWTEWMTQTVLQRERERAREREKPSHLRSIISHRLIEICNNLESTKNSKPRAIPRPFDSLKTRQFLTWRDSWGFCLEMTKARRRIWIPHLLHLEGAFSLAQLCSPS